MEKTHWTRTLFYSFASIFIIWHVIGFSIVGPFVKGSLNGDGLISFYKQYLAIIHLNGAWSFYSKPGNGKIISYETINTAGVTRKYPLTHAHGKFYHVYFRYTNFYNVMFSWPRYTKERGYDKSVASYLCKQHGSNNVKSVRFIMQQQLTFTHEDYRKGKRPLDNEFLKKHSYRSYDCMES